MPKNSLQPLHPQLNLFWPAHHCDSPAKANLSSDLHKTSSLCQIWNQTLSLCTTKMTTSLALDYNRYVVLVICYSFLVVRSSFVQLAQVVIPTLVRFVDLEYTSGKLDRELLCLKLQWGFSFQFQILSVCVHFFDHLSLQLVVWSPLDLRKILLLFYFRVQYSYFRYRHCNNNCVLFNNNIAITT